MNINAIQELEKLFRDIKALQGRVEKIIEEELVEFENKNKE